jgi:predicted Zn-dependent protease
VSVSSFSSSSRELLNFVAEVLFRELHENESLLVNFRGEETDFLRFNHSKVRQNTSVLQRHITFELQKDQRRLRKGFAASGNLEWDLIEARQLLTQARLEIQSLPMDPHLVPFTNNGTSEAIFNGNLLSSEEVIEAIAKPAKNFDLAGLYAGGSIAVGNRNSKGQNHWFANNSFFVDFSLYHGEQAVKSSYAHFQWQQSKFEEALSLAAAQLEIMKRPRIKVSPGEYRVYLAPGALSELAPMFSWGALSYQALRDGLCAFKKLADKERTLSEKFSLSENFSLGLTPRFNVLGELSREKIPLIEAGVLRELLVSSRSAREYKVLGNQAAPDEMLRALEIHPGTLAKDHILKELGTGLFLSNLHYANWSDLQSARVTGMTRYGCFWVENGQIVGPIDDMRFDVSFYEIFGKDLLAVTDFQELDPVIDTYGERSLGGRRLPGMLIENFKLTL